MPQFPRYNEVMSYASLQDASMKPVGVAPLRVLPTGMLSKALRGISTHGIHWFPQYVNLQAFQALRDQWQANVIRLAMYVEEGGFTQDGGLSGTSYKKMCEGIDACIALGLYAIVDWHVSNADQTPLKHGPEAVTFFSAILDKYGNCPNILYEICNEPNNAGNDYASQIADYADDMIRTIRAKAPNAVVIIGSGHWSKDCVEAWQFDKANRNGGRKNVLYTLHRYCDGDFDKWAPAIRAAVLAGCPIIATECGVSNSGEWDWNTQDEFQKVIRFYEEVGISWQIWSLADKVEPSSILSQGAPGNPPPSGWTDAQISKAGHLVKDALNNYAALFPCPPPPGPTPEPVEISSMTVQKGEKLSLAWDGDTLTLQRVKS